MFRKKRRDPSPRWVNYGDEEKRFFQAIQMCNVELVEELLSPGPFREHLDEEDKVNLAFLQVVLLNSIPMLEVLLRHGVDITTCDCMFYENGLMHAARYGHKEMLEKLINCGLGVNLQCANGSTALHIAVENEQRECLEILTQQRAIDLNIHDDSGFSPLLWTARLRDWQSMKILVNAGCNVESRHFIKGSNALHTVVDATQAFWKGVKATAEDAEKCIELLLNVGLDINSCDPHGLSPLIYALRSNNTHAVASLLKYNCSFTTAEQQDSLVMPFYFHKTLTGSDPELLPLYVAISKLQMSSVRMLYIAGIPIHKLAAERAIIDYMQDCYPPMAQLLNVLVYEPLTLRQACRNMVRSSMLKNVRYLDKAMLNLPTAMIQYLSLCDLTELQRLHFQKVLSS